MKGRISGYIATVEVTQQYRNPYEGKIEAVYVFPLPHNAAVNEFLMTIGERKIRGIIRERQEAEKIYQEAKAQGFYSEYDIFDGEYPIEVIRLFLEEDA